MIHNNNTFILKKIKLNMFKLAKVNSGKLKPYFEKSRPACPFYGFHLALERFNAMVDQKGNECALVDGYKPCQMEIQKLIPCWNNCSSYSSKDIENLKKIEEKVQVFPKEFRPPKARSWTGIKLKDWMQYIQNKKAS